MNKTLEQQYGNIDIYLFDQLLKGRFDSCKSVLDVGCGNGRNLVYFLQHGFEVYGIDQNPSCIDTVIQLSAKIAPTNPEINFKVAQADAIPFYPETFDIVICSAVLHFAENKAHFENMLLECWRVLKPGGFFFARLASDIGIENLVKATGDGKYRLPDGSIRYLVNQQQLLDYAKAFEAELFEPIKTTNVQNLRCMTTWCMIK